MVLKLKSRPRLENSGTTVYLTLSYTYKKASEDFVFDFARILALEHPEEDLAGASLSINKRKKLIHEKNHDNVRRYKLVRQV